MRKNSMRVCLLVGALVTLGNLGKAQADISWSGNYRIEAVKVTGPELDSNQSRKAYLLHHLVLQPKLVAADGINIYGRFDILNDDRGHQSLAGQSFGTGPNPTNNPGASAAGSASNNSNVFGDSQNPNAPIWVTQLYATWTQEFGVFVAGRAPLQFGLGMNYSDGSGLFDHYMSNRDMVGYKAVLGNLSVMPIMAKMNEGALEHEDDVNDYILHLQYDNPETDLALGLFYQLRVATAPGNDVPNNGSAGGTAAATDVTGYKSQQINVFTAQRWNHLSLGVEAGFNTGETGLRTATTGGGAVKINSYGAAAELKHDNPERRWAFGAKAGVASGDDPGTADTYEGFIFNRNYNVGMLMFNHPLGKADHLRTGVIRDTTTRAAAQIDSEAVSNAVYFAPNFQHRLREKLSWGGMFVWAMAGNDAYPGMGSNLGYELDLNVTYKPYERMSWVTEVGMLSPGDAWRAGPASPSAFENKFTYGISTKAAITF